MKILQVMAGAEHGGAEMAFVDMCVALHEAGEEIEVVTRANDVRVPLLHDAGLTVHTAPFGGAVDVYTNWRVGKIISKFQPQIVQTWMSRAALKTPNWSSLKTSQRYLSVARLGGYYKVSNFRNMDYFVTITPDLKRHLVDGGVMAEKVRFINNFAETEKNVGVIRKSDLGTPDDAPVLLTLARLHENKALDVLIRALPRLPGVHAWLAGEGPDRAKLEKLAEECGVAERVKFLGWRTDRAALLRAADICVFASRIEPFGTVFAQAWAEKTPVIVSDADGPRQFCRDGEDSLMVPRDDVDALGNAIARLLGDKALQQTLVKNGYQRYLNEFTRDKCVSAYMGFYLDMLKRERLI